MNDSIVEYQGAEMNEALWNDSADDMQATISSTLALRKNLTETFNESALEVKGSGAVDQQENKSNKVENSKTHDSTLVPSRSEVHSSVPVTNSTSETDGLSVFLRIRPTKQESTVKIINSQKVRTYPPRSSQKYKSTRQDLEPIKEFDFTKVFAEESSQLEVYGRAASSMVRTLVDRERGIGQSGLLFSYGVTNAGKTYTVLGNIAQKKENWGLVPRTVADILDRTPNDVGLSLSYFEIYNEQIFDLLPDEAASKFVVRQPEPLKVGERNGRAVVKDLTTHSVKTLQEGLDLIVSAKERRVTASNNINRGSSRSHCVCQLTVHSNEQDPSTLERKEATLWIVDLAGSERSKKTGVNIIRQKEAASINKSLMTLMRCLSVLRGKNEHPKAIPPYRESKLSLLFMSHLTSSAATNTAMIVNIHPGVDEYDETQYVLQYAATSRNISVADLQNARKKISTTTVEYGYDGRKKGGHLASRVKGVLKKLSPMRPKDNRKRKNNDSKQHCITEKACLEPVAKKNRSDENQEDTDGISTNMSKEIRVLRMQLAVTESEVSTLRSQNQDLERSLLDSETQIRHEVSIEMDEHMRQVRSQYESTIKNLQQKLRKQQLPSFPTGTSIDPKDGKVEELTMNIRECEDEMNRMREEHYQEMASLRTEHEKLIAAKDAELAEARGRGKKTRELEEKLKEVNLLRDDEIKKMSTTLENSRARIAELEAELRTTNEVQIQKHSDFDEHSSAREKEAGGDFKHQSQVNENCDPNQCDGESLGKSISGPSVSGPKLKRQEAGISECHSSLTTSNEIERSESDSSEDTFCVSKWLVPKGKVVRNAKSGKYKRPRGRAPSGVSGWDDQKGAWVLHGTVEP